ncbi:MAG: cation-transporting P-type ATPase, partial [Aeromonadales bacterium]|nr:cation-transporting P-type ATPase [Aeromonadales bacterium]
MITTRIPLPAHKFGYNECAEAEARLRACPDVASAVLGDGFAKITFIKGGRAEKAGALLCLSKILGQRIIAGGADIARNSAGMLMPRKDEQKGEADIEGDFKSHRAAALVSLGFFVFFEALKRLAPTTFATTGLLRSAAVLIMASNLLKSGVGGAIRERKPNADTLTVTAVLASVAAGKPESSLTLLTLSNCAEMLTTYAARRARSNIKKLVD